MFYAYAAFDVDEHRARVALEELAFRYLLNIAPKQLGKNQLDVLLGWPDDASDDIAYFKARHAEWAREQPGQYDERLDEPANEFRMLVLATPYDFRLPSVSVRGLSAALVRAWTQGASLPVLMRAINYTLWIEEDAFARARATGVADKLTRLGWRVAAGSDGLFAMQRALDEQALNWRSTL